jgi:uncharacterized hydrophobic protein (TIGR00271 family)
MAGSTAASPPDLIDARLSLGRAQLDDLYPEGEAFRRSVVTFIALLALAALIASFGLYQDSVAAIIGAMVVAPLGGAIMAFAGALVTARSRWQWVTAIEILGGAALVVALAYAVSWIIPDPLSLTPSLDARTEPGPLDLGVALAAGAAGAYVAVRRTGSDALPGVAIAVSLVPPLATVGICLELGRLDDAAGALVLFLTNFAAITVVACVVFLLAGAGPSRELTAERRRLRAAILAAVIALIAISVPLALNGIDSVRTIVRSTTGAPIVRAWIGDLDLVVTAWDIDGDVVTLLTSGSDAPPDAQALADDLSAAFASPVELRIDHVPLVRASATGTP